MTPRASVAQPHVVEHGLLRRGLRLFIANEHGKNDRLASKSVYVAGVERRVQVNDLVQIRYCVAREFSIGIRAKQIATEAESNLELPGRCPFDTCHRVAARRRG